jgi:AcrR family transcriptional regulator
MAETATRTKKGGDRAIRSARIKLNILSSTLDLLGKKSFKDLHVEQICSRAGVSKVTFFKYFPQKEDVLLYFMRVWSLRRSVELFKEPRSGLQGVYYLFDRMADTFERYPGLPLSVVSYWTSDNSPPSAFPLKDMEKRILYPGKRYVTDMQVFTVPQFLEHFLLEAIMNREIQRVSDSRELTNLFMSILYGTLITAHVRQVSPLRMIFRRHIDMTLKGIQDSIPGF